MDVACPYYVVQPQCRQPNLGFFSLFELFIFYCINQYSSYTWNKHCNAELKFVLWKLSWYTLQAHA